MHKPTPIIFKLNSVQLDRASAATLSRNLEYASSCCLTKGSGTEAPEIFLEVIDQSSCASEYSSDTCSKSFSENPINDKDE